MAKRYDSEFKEKAVRRYLNSLNLGVTACARELGISQNSLSNWIMKFQKEHTKEYETIMKAQEALLKKKIKEANEEIDRLKTELCWWNWK